jgi:hypothetical protein
VRGAEVVKPKEATCARSRSRNSAAAAGSVLAFNDRMATGKFAWGNRIGSVVRPLHSGLRRSIDFGIGLT